MHPVNQRYTVHLVLIRGAGFSQLFATFQNYCSPHPTTHSEHKTTTMDVHFEDFRADQHTVEVGADDTVEGLRRKVASAMGLPEDSFCMSFGSEAMGEGYDMTQLSADDTIVLTKSKKYEAVAALHDLGETDLTAERLEEVEDPEVACLLLQAGVATVIPDGFLAETSLTRLDLSAVSFVTQIEDNFLRDCALLTSIDLSGLSNVTQVGKYFLVDCEALPALDLTPLNNVTVLEEGFLAGCKSLTTLHLSPLNNVIQISAKFLFGCKALTTLDLSPFNRITQLHRSFLSGCEALTTLDLLPLKNVTKIESFFLYRCKGLAALDLSPLNNVTKIEKRFLSGCEALASLDLTPLSKVKAIDGSFLSGCKGLTTLDLTPLSKVRRVVSQFAADCTSLTRIYLPDSCLVSDLVTNNKKLRHLVVEARPKRSRDESPEQARKRQRHAE